MTTPKLLFLVLLFGITGNILLNAAQTTHRRIPSTGSTGKEKVRHIKKRRINKQGTSILKQAHKVGPRTPAKPSHPSAKKKFKAKKHTESIHKQPKELKRKNLQKVHVH